MKTSEFIQKVEELGLYDGHFSGGNRFIKDKNDHIVFCVSEEFRYTFSNDWVSYIYLPEDFRLKIFNIINQYASTAIEDRKDDNSEVETNYEYKYFCLECGCEFKFKYTNECNSAECPECGSELVAAFPF